MEKVYRIYEYVYEDSYSPTEETTLGIFTDKAVADDIVSKLKIGRENKLSEYDIEYRKLEEVLFKLSYEERYNHKFSEDYKELSIKAQRLEITNYYIEEIIINQLIK
jgi:exoribonuclease II